MCGAERRIAMIGRLVMVQPIRRILSRIAVALSLVLRFAAPGLAAAQARGASDLVNGVPPPVADTLPTDFLVFGVLGLAAVSAAVAVRMVRRWH